MNRFGSVITRGEPNRQQPMFSRINTGASPSPSLNWKNANPNPKSPTPLPHTSLRRRLSWSALCSRTSVSGNIFSTSTFQLRSSSKMRPILMKGHERPLTFLKYNRDGDLLFSCAKDHNPTVWYADNGERLGTYRGHNGAVWCCDVSSMLHLFFFYFLFIQIGLQSNVKLKLCLVLL